MKKSLAATLLIPAFTVFCAPASSNNEVRVSAVESQRTDSAYFADLQQVEAAAKAHALKLKLTDRRCDRYVARQIEKYKGYNDFARQALVPHARTVLKSLGDPDAMLRRGEAMLKDDPESWQGFDLVASGSLLKQDARKALADFQGALARAPQPQKDWYRFMIAGCHRMLKNDAQALALYEEVIAHDSNWPAVKGALLSASMLLAANGRLDEAVAYFDRGMALATPAEKEALIKRAGACGKFPGKKPQACAEQA